MEHLSLGLFDYKASTLSMIPKKAKAMLGGSRMPGNYHFSVELNLAEIIEWIEEMIPPPIEWGEMRVRQDS